MVNQNKRTKFIGMAIFILVLVMMVMLRNVSFNYKINEKKNEGKDILKIYQEKILSNLHYELNYAYDVAQRISNDPSDIQQFRENADRIIEKFGAGHISLIKDKKIISAVPEEKFGYMIGTDLKGYPYAFTMARVINDRVVDGPKDFLKTDNSEFLFIEPVQVENDEWFAVAACLNKEKVLKKLKLEKIEKRGYEYELWSIDAQNGDKTIIDISDATFDFSKSERINFEMPGTWTLAVMPKSGWLSAEEKLKVNLFFVVLLFLAAAIIWISVRYIGERKVIKYSGWIDSQSSFYNRAGFQKEIAKWIKNDKKPFTIIYFVIDDYNRLAQSMGKEKEKEYLAGVKSSIENFIFSDYLVGRLGEGNFAIAIHDNMEHEQIDDIVKGLAMDLPWKSQRGNRKEFLNVGSMYVSYPADADEAGKLIDKVIDEYFSGVVNESPAVSLTEKCHQLIRGDKNVEFGEYTDTEMTRLSKAINQYQKKVEQLAYYDSVLYIGNRSKFIRDMQVMISYNKKRQITLYCIEICTFGRYNEMFNVEIEDSILKQVSQKLKKIFGDYLYRINGDIFIGVLLEHNNIQETLDKARNKLAVPFQVDSIKLTLDYRFGVCEYPHHGTTPEQLLDSAQKTLYFARQNNSKQAVIYDQALTDIFHEEVHILDLLETSLKDNTLEVWYQPVKYLKSNAYLDYEALLRIKDTDGHIIRAEKVIPIAEKTRMMDRIGFYVREKVYAFAQENRKKLGMEGIGINVSAQELLSDDFAERVLMQYSKYTLPNGFITLEITEAVLIKSFDKVLSALFKLKEAGIRIGLDDFGSGYSSLNYLYKLPVGVIKIDRELVRNIDEPKKQLSVIKAIVDMARSNNILVVAVGVETKEEKAVIEQTGVDYVQGFEYSLPMSTEEILQKNT